MFNEVLNQFFSAVAKMHVHMMAEIEEGSGYPCLHLVVREI